MRPMHAVRSLFVAGVALALVFGVAGRSQAANTFFTTTYKVQVQYWFFDTDYYYWSTKFETTNYNDAKFVYDLLKAADDAGQLNSVAPASYWRYIAVDVRMISEVNYPRYALAESYYPVQNLQAIGRAVK